MWGFVYFKRLAALCEIMQIEDGKTSQQMEKDVKQQRGLTGTAGEEGKDEGRNKANLELGKLSV